MNEPAPRDPVWLLQTAILIAHEMTLATHGGGEGIRDSKLLESALARPKNLFGYAAPDLAQLAAAYTFGIVRNHPFVDGNKRTGFLAGVAFLELNGFQFTASEPDATRMIMSVAAGETGEDVLAEWYRLNIRYAVEND